MKPQIFKDEVAAFADSIEYIESWEAVYKTTGNPEDFSAVLAFGLGSGQTGEAVLVVDWEEGREVGIQVGGGDHNPIEATAENLFAILLSGKVEQLAEILTIVDDDSLAYAEGGRKIEDLFYPYSAAEELGQEKKGEGAAVFPAGSVTAACIYCGDVIKMAPGIAGDPESFQELRAHDLTCEKGPFAKTMKLLQQVAADKGSALHFEAVELINAGPGDSTDRFGQAKTGRPEPAASFLGTKPEEAIADALLTNGNGDKADRLVLMTSDAIGLGGRCRSSIIQTIREAVLAIATADSPMVDKLEDGGRY